LFSSFSYKRFLFPYKAFPDRMTSADEFSPFGEQAHAFVQLASEPNAFERTRRDAHFTGSAWLVSGDGQRVLLTHHRKLDRWLQLGGHADGDTDLAQVALREAEEESGLTDLAIEGGVFDIDRHLIPARGEEPAHWHYDVRYVVRARGSEQFAVSSESLALAWWPIADIAADASGTERGQSNDSDPHSTWGVAAWDDSMRRMAMRWLARES
jgi:8-oxo-dGTP pyrophosphatase MutT (NUDIX family)